MLIQVVPFVVEPCLELCLVGSFVAVQCELFQVVSFTMVVSFTVQYELFLVVSFITVQYELLLEASFMALCIDGVVCYWAICALSGIVGYYCAMWAVFSSVIFTECELCLTRVICYCVVCSVLAGSFVIGQYGVCHAVSVFDECELCLAVICYLLFLVVSFVTVQCGLFLDVVHSFLPQASLECIPVTIVELLVTTRPDWGFPFWMDLFTRSLAGELQTPR